MAGAIPRLDDQAAGVGAIGLRIAALGRADVVAAPAEDAGLVPQHVIQQAPVRHDAHVPARREVAARERAIVEIEIHAARELIEAERDLELSGAQLQERQDPRVEVRVAPRPRRVAQLPLDLVIEPLLHEVAVDTNARAMEIKHVLRIGGRFQWKIAEVHLRLQAEVHAEHVADLDGGTLVERQLDLGGGRPHAAACQRDQRRKGDADAALRRPLRCVRHFVWG